MINVESEVARIEALFPGDWAQRYGAMVATARFLRHERDGALRKLANTAYLVDEVAERCTIEQAWHVMSTAVEKMEEHERAHFESIMSDLWQAINDLATLESPECPADVDDQYAYRDEAPIPSRIRDDNAAGAHFGEMTIEPSA